MVSVTINSSIVTGFGMVTPPIGDCRVSP